MEKESPKVRFDGRNFNQLRPIKFEPGIAPNATGSVLVSFGNRRGNRGKARAFVDELHGGAKGVA